ncbi:MAG: 50S ribosomal protein L31 [Chloroflexota bacterium]|jgi:large subunit ribosomal protein L31
MKKGIHPKYGESVIVCSCGAQHKTASTKPNLKVDVCSQCHPFFTGEQRIVDTAGRVDKFMKKLQKRGR